jgi:hypothetical protein
MFTYLTEAAAAAHYADLRREADLWRLAAAARGDDSSRPRRRFRRAAGRHAGQSRRSAATATRTASAASTTHIDALRAIPGYADADSRPASARRHAA